MPTSSRLSTVKRRPNILTIHSQFSPFFFVVIVPFANIFETALDEYTQYNLRQLTEKFHMVIYKVCVQSC